jgi:hypothetical protein
MSEYAMERIEIKKEEKRKKGNTAKICFEGLGVPFELQSVLGGKIQEITVEDGYFKDGWEGTDQGQNELLRRGTFILTVSVAVPKGNPGGADFKHGGCGGA